ncbi:MAG: Methyltransferase type 11 [Microgenomates group bacterium GW2011_GWC1_39_7]|nr:MAG: Methyltransferase type 11 [Microgenomates group bacterium GW2011_GWC1_39_7]
MKDIAYELMYESEQNHWWDKARRKIVFGLIKQYCHASVVKPKILDLGCGMGIMAKESESVGDYHGIDVSERAVNFCRQRGVKNIRQGDALHIPYPDGYFDIVLLMDVIEHIEDDSGVIAEARRVLRPHGIVIITAPAFQFLWGSTDVTHQHYRRYRLKELKLKLKEENLSILKASYLNTFLSLPIVFFRMAAKYLHLSMKSENELSRQMVNNIWVINKIFYIIFSMESILLRYINFPFGISVVVVGRKQDS